MNGIMIVDLPKPHGKVRGCWYNGYPIHRGQTKSSLNYATVFASQNHIIPNQRKIRNDFRLFVKNLKGAGFCVHILPFPRVLNQPNNLHHDAIFIRDAGLMFGDTWIKANFSVKDRVIESDIWASIISKKFKKKILKLPNSAFLEFGEVFYLQTKNGSYYFGGLSRSNRQGHDFVRSIVRPDRYLLIKSKGYHLDTVFCPILSPDNKLTAFLVARNMIEKKSLAALKQFGIGIIYVDSMDSSGRGNQLGNYAINAMVAPGIMLNCAKFLTKGVENKLESLGIKRYISPLTYFRFAGGSCHCLTNEIYT